MNKKGQGLPLTTIIVAILVVVVLVVIVAFFLGGTTGLTNTIKRVFFGTTAGTDLSLAVEACRNHCDRAASLPKSLQGSSAYCTTKFRIDKDGSGEADSVGEGDSRQFIDWYCWNVGQGPGGNAVQGFEDYAGCGVWLVTGTLHEAGRILS